MSLDFSWMGKQRGTQGRPLLPLGLPGDPSKVHVLMGADEGGLRLCISNKPPGYGVHRQNKRRATGRQGSPESSGGKPVQAMAEALKQSQQILGPTRCLHPSQEPRPCCVYSVTQPHWVTETTSKELPVKSPKR